MFILFFSIVIVMMGYGIAMPVLPFYLESLGGRGIHYGLLIASYGIMQLIFAPIWGSLSDKYGRKPLLLIGMMGMGSAMLLFAVATELWMLYAAQLFSGSLSSATLPAAQAYAGDSTTMEERGGAMGKIGGAIGLGMVFGPGIGGLLGSMSLATPFLVASGFCLFTFLLILLGLPESLDRDNRSVTVQVQIMQVKGMWHMLFAPMGYGLVASFVGILGQTIFTSTFGLYVIARFDYEPAHIGTVLMGMALMYALAQGLLVGPLTRRYGEKKVISIGALGGALGFVLILLATSFVTIFLAMSGFILLVALLKPSALSYVSKRAGDTQGKAMGIAESYMSLGRIIAPLWAGMVFDINIYYPYISGTVIFLSVFIITLRLHKSPLGTELESSYQR